MSQENVELVKALHPPSGTQLTFLFSDAQAEAQMRQALAPFVHPDFEIVGGNPHHPGLSISGKGVDGLLEAWRDWLEPWETYWTEVEDFVDAGDDHVLVLVRDHGRLAGADAEIELVAGSVWTVREGKIARIEFHTSRETALEAAGLSG